MNMEQMENKLMHVEIEGQFAADTCKLAPRVDELEKKVAFLMDLLAQKVAKDFVKQMLKE